MNTKEILAEHKVHEEQATSILSGLKIKKNVNDALSDPQVTAVKAVCGLLQQKMPVDKATAQVLAESTAKSSSALERSEAGELSTTVNSVLEVARPQVEAEVTRIYGRTPQILADLENQYIAGIYAIAGDVLLREAKKMRDSTGYAVLDAEKDAAALPAARKGNDS